MLLSTRRKGNEKRSYLLGLVFASFQVLKQLFLLFKVKSKQGRWAHDDCKAINGGVNGVETPRNMNIHGC